MRKLSLKLRNLKNSFWSFFIKNETSILLIAAILVAAFILSEMKSLRHDMEKKALMRDNVELMRDNSNLNFLKTRHLMMLNEQHKRILDLERFKKAILEGNYTQNENTKQKQRKVVGQRKIRDLGI